MRLKTVAEQWARFWSCVAPVGVSDAQQTDMRRAYYAGVFSAVCACRDIGSDTVFEDDAVDYLEGLYRECLAFNELVKAGKA